MTYIAKTLIIASLSISTVMTSLFVYAHFAQDSQFAKLVPSNAVFFGDGEPVQATLVVSGSMDATTKEKFRGLLSEAFSAKGVPMDFKVSTDASQTLSTVTYTVGSSTIGPLPLSRASEGVMSAAAAYKMDL